MSIHRTKKTHIKGKEEITRRIRLSKKFSVYLIKKEETVRKVCLTRPFSKK